MADLHLVFMHDGVRYALDAATVLRITWLPELLPLADASPKVVGAFNLHGHVIPVLDLSLFFRHGPSRRALGDTVVVLEADGERFGIVAAELLDAAPISPGDIESVAAEHALLGCSAHLLRGVAMQDEALAMVLDVRALRAAAVAENAPATPGVAHGSTGPLPDDQIAVLRSRARGMAQLPQRSCGAGDELYVQVRLDAEALGIPARAVREMMHLREVWPVPCCPPHILGSMNVRGDIMTLVDLRPVLGLPAQRPLAEVVVVGTGALAVGIAVSEVLEVAGATGLAALPGERRELPFCRGAARSGERVFGVIDIEAMLGSRALHVNEEPGCDRPVARAQVL